MIAIFILLLAGLITWAFFRWVRLIECVAKSWLPRRRGSRLVEKLFSRFLK